MIISTDNSLVDDIVTEKNQTSGDLGKLWDPLKTMK